MAGYDSRDYRMKAQDILHRSTQAEDCTDTLLSLIEQVYRDGYAQGLGDGKRLIKQAGIDDD